MTTITSVWIRISDENGNEALEVFDLDLKNAKAPITIEDIAFYSKGEDGINRKLETIIKK